MYSYVDNFYLNFTLVTKISKTLCFLRKMS